MCCHRCRTLLKCRARAVLQNHHARVGQCARNCLHSFHFGYNIYLFAIKNDSRVLTSVPFFPLQNIYSQVLEIASSAPCCPQVKVALKCRFINKHFSIYFSRFSLVRPKLLPRAHKHLCLVCLYQVHGRAMQPHHTCFSWEPRRARKNVSPSSSLLIPLLLLVVAQRGSCGDDWQRIFTCIYCGGSPSMHFQTINATLLTCALNVALWLIR